MKTSEFHKSNEKQLAMIDQMMNGGETTEAATSSADEQEAYLAGCEAGASNASCSENPYPDRGSPQAKEWHRGWEECSASE